MSKFSLILSDEFADAQSKYLSLKTEAENARQNYERTQKLVTINQAGHTELDQAAKQRKAAERRKTNAWSSHLTSRMSVGVDGKS